MNNENVNKNVIRDKSFNFALMIIEIVKILRNKREYVFANQLLKSGTSVGANIQEAIASVSRKEFHSKMAISSKEARETRYWLRLIKASGTLDSNQLNKALADIEEIIRILTAIVKTTRFSIDANDRP